MKGINYFSRHDAFGSEQISFENAIGILNDTLKKSAVLSVDANTFANEDGSAFTGQVVLSVTGDYVRGFMALNSTPTVSDNNPLITEGSVYFDASDIYGHKLKIASGKNLTIAIPGGSVSAQNQMYYADDNVKDPSPANTSLFNWKESSTDIVENYLDANSSKYFYKLKPAQLGWVSCSRVVTNSNPVGLKVRVWGINPIFATNTAIYLVPKNSKSVFRLWNYDKPSNTFSLDKPYLENGTDVYIIVIASVRHFKIYYSREECVVGANTFKTVTAAEASLNSIASNLYSL